MLVDLSFKTFNNPPECGLVDYVCNYCNNPDLNPLYLCAYGTVVGLSLQDRGPTAMDRLCWTDCVRRRCRVRSEETMICEV